MFMIEFRRKKDTMQEITIEFTGQNNLILHGELLFTSSDEKNRSWKFRLFDNGSDEEIIIPNSSIDYRNVSMTIRTDNIQINPSFWSIESIKSDNDIFLVTIYPNSFDLLKRYIK